jgi:hypothetical protein
MARFERGIPDAIVENSNEVYIDEEGVPRSGVNLAVSAEVVEQYRQGYRCLKCQHVNSEPFPEVCEARDVSPGGRWRCGFRMREQQMQLFELQFQGEKYYGPTPLDPYREQWEREDWKPKTGIWLPRGIKGA